MVEHALGGLDVVRAPVVDNRGQHRLGTEVGHVRSVADGVDAAPLGGLDRRRAVGVLEHHIHALVDQCVGGALHADVLTHTTLISVPGLYLFRASWMALISRITSGIGKEAT